MSTDPLADELKQAIRERDQYRELCGRILAALRANLLRQTIVTTNDEDFEKMLNMWLDRLNSI